MKRILSVLAKIIHKLRIKIVIFYLKLKYTKKIKIGKNLEFRKRFKIRIDGSGKLEIGDNNFFNDDCSINCMGKIQIGNNNLFGENVKIYDHNHVFNRNEEELRKKFKSKQLIIGDNNWFGTNVVILKNSMIGNRNVIGAGTILDTIIDSKNLVTSNRTINIEKINIKEDVL